MATNEHFVQASTNLKKCLAQISIANGNLNEDVIPLFKLNQLRYELSYALYEVENIFKLYAHVDSPRKLFDSSMASSLNQKIKTDLKDSLKVDINKDFSVNNQQVESSSALNSANLPEEASATDNLISGVKKTEPDSCQNLDTVGVINSSTFTNLSGNSSQSSSKQTVVIDLSSDSQSDASIADSDNISKFINTSPEILALLSSLESVLVPKPVNTESESSTQDNERPSTGGNDTVSSEKSPPSENTINRRKISAREFFARKPRYSSAVTSEAPYKMRRPKYASTNSCYEKHFVVVKNKSKFSVIKRPNSFNTRVLKFPHLRACRMCGHFNKIISPQGQKTCRNCQYTDFL